MRRHRQIGLLISAIVAAGMLSTATEARHRSHHKWSDYNQQEGSKPADEKAEPEETKRAPAPQTRDEAPRERNAAGQFDYYALVLSWSPAFCASGGHDDSPQCSQSNPRPYSFVLHGLWPQYDKGWPQDCPTRAPAYVPRPLINEMLDIMPASQLVIHEYKKHGTCSGLDPAAYYALARKLYTGVKIPERFNQPTGTQLVSPDDVIADFRKSNPEIKDDMIAVSCSGSGDRLREVHICVSKDGKPASCGKNEVQRKMCSADKMTVLPVRGAKAAAAAPSAPAASAGPKKTMSGAILEYFGRRK